MYVTVEIIILYGNHVISRDNEPLYNHRVVLKEKIYAIEKPKLLENRDPNDKTSRSNIRRPIAPDCFSCYDKVDVNCKECGCAVCGGKNNPQLILLCDECEDEYHITCLRPPLSEIPKDDWYCSKCKNDENEIIKVKLEIIIMFLKHHTLINYILQFSGRTNGPKKTSQ